MKKITSFFLFFLIIANMLLILSYNSYGIVTYSTGFEDGTVLLQYSNEWLTTETENAFFSVTNTPTFMGVRSFRAIYENIIGSAKGWFNFTYPSNEILTDFNMWAYIPSPSDNFPLTMHFRNDTTIIMTLRVDTNLLLEYRDFLGAYQTITSLTFDTWYNIGLTILDNDSVTYYTNETSVSGTPFTIQDRPRINNIYHDNSQNGVDEGYFMDNIRMTTDTDYDGFGGCGDFSEYDFIGTIKDRFQLQVTNPIIEEYYNIPITADFVGIDLFINQAQFNGDNNILNYFAFLNTNSLGNPVCIYPFLGGYVVRWDKSDFPVEISDSPLSIEFRHTVPYSGSIYWAIGTGDNSLDDLDSDGDVTLRHSGDINGLYDGTSQPYDIAYRLYYKNLNIEIDDPDLIDSLSGHNAIGTLFNLPSYYTSTTVFLAYTLSNIQTGTYIRIWNDDTGVEVGLTQGFGLGTVLTQYFGVKGFVSFDIGNYTAYLYRGNVNLTDPARYSFYIEQNPDNDKILFTLPNPSTSTHDYLVNYTYNHIDGWSGAVAIGYTSNFNSLDDSEFYVNINSGDSGTFIYSPTEIRTHYWRIFTDFNNGSTSVPYSGVHRHYIIDQTNILPELNVAFQTIELKENPSQQSSQIISGKHPYLGCNVKIKINGIIIADVSDIQIFKTVNAIFWTPDSLGFKTVTLELNQNNTWIVLARINFTVSGDIPDIPSDFDNIFASIPVFIRALLGAILTIGFTLLPLVLIGTMKKINFKVDVPPVIYAICGGIGVVFSTMIGLFDSAIMFFICVIAGISLVISYVWSERSD